MNTLCTTRNFLTSHEEVVGVGVVRVVGVEHRIEWTGICGIAVEHVEVSVIFFTDKSSKLLLVLSIQILKWVLNVSVVSKQLDSFLEVEADVFALELLIWILVSHYLELFRIACFQPIEDVHKHISKDIKYFEIVLVEHHFDIETCELA